MTYIYTFASVLGISLVSLVGVAMLVWEEKRLRKIFPALVSFAAGALLGDVFLHVLPELSESGMSALKIGASLLVGVWAFFLLERIIHYHHGHEDDGGSSAKAASYLVLLGDGLHNFLDGLVIAAAFQINVSVGFATTIAVLLHELPQEFGDFAILIRGGFSAKKALFLNFLSALTAVLGAALGLLIGEFGGSSWLLAVAASSFLYISMSDLIPEMHKEIHNHGRRWWMDLLMLVLGGLVMASLLLLE